MWRENFKVYIFWLHFVPNHHIFSPIIREVKSGIGINEPTESSLEMNSDLMESLNRIKEIKNRIVEAKSGI